MSGVSGWVSVPQRRDAREAIYEPPDRSLWLYIWAETCVTCLPLIWNSDQGSHFTSPQYCALLRDAKVQRSQDGKGRALDTIFTERLWRSVKYEEVYVHDYTSPKEARQQLGRYFEFSNQQRLHQALDYRTPAEVYSTETPTSSF